MTAKRLLMVMVLMVFLVPDAGAKSKPASLKRPSYATVQMRLQPIVHRLAANTRRLRGIRTDLQEMVARAGSGQGLAMDAQSLGHIRQIDQALVELTLRMEHQMELMEMAVLIEIESKHDYFMRRLDRLHLSREIILDLLEQINGHIAKIQNNPALRLVERAKFVIQNTLEQYDSGIAAISALEPAVRAGK